MKERFDYYRDKLREAFPVWTKIRKDKHAIGSQFLSVMGITLGEVEWLLDYAYDQVYIGTADIHQIDWVYKARIPNQLTPEHAFRFVNDSHILQESENLYDFLSPMKQAIHHMEIQYQNQYYIDYQAKYVNVRHSFGANHEYPEGKLELVMENGNMREILPLMIHHVWNFFDEFGLLLDTPRLWKENNAAYKERLLDVFRRPADSTYRGLINGMARELGLIREYTWDDGSKDFILFHDRIDIDSIYVDNMAYNDYVIQADGTICLKGSSSHEGIQRRVRFIAGIDLHELHDKNDQAFQNRLYQVDGSATPLLHYYVEQIRNLAPIMWGEWKWDEGFWDSVDENFSGYGAVPSLYDAKISGWSEYKE